MSAEDLDQELKKLATENWDEFKKIFDENAIVTAKIRLLKKKGKSYRQVSLKLGVSISQTRHAVKKTDKN